MRSPAQILRCCAAALVIAWLSAPLAASAGAPASRTYDVSYEVTLDPAAGLARVAMQLQGDALPSRLTFRIEPDRHRNFRGDGRLETEGSTVVWFPQAGRSTLSFDFRVDNTRGRGSFDSYMTAEWALFRGDRLIPPVSVRAIRGLRARTLLEFSLPPQWSVATPYAEQGRNRFTIDNPARRFDRPTGWILAGRIGTRQERITGISTIVAAPAGEDARRQDTLAFLNWNLPHVAGIFPRFPRRLLVIRAGDPMFRGGLSGPASLFLHADRPLISENRTSTLLHELVHVAMGIRGDDESDWIVEGFAEYYSIEVLRRSGGISERRFRDAIGRQDDWGRRAPDLFVRSASGPVTARAVMVLHAADEEIRAATRNAASLDDVARILAEERGEVTLAGLQAVAAKVAGRTVAALDRSRLENRN